MPELPEVETVVKSLAGIKGQKISTGKVHQRKLRIGSQIPDDFEERISNSIVIDIRRIAKYITIELLNKEVIIIHLGMSGNVLLKDKNYIRQKHDHVEIDLTEGKVIYCDPRRFGLIDLIKKDEVSEYFKKKKIGIDALSEEFNEIYFKDRLKGNKTVIKQTLLNQSIVAGLGNIYVCEALFLSHINPSRPSCSLKDEEVKALIKNIKEVLRKSIKQGGTTLKDHKDASGNPGYFIQELSVYGKEHQPCPHCQTAIERTIISGRSTFFCKKCQK